MAVHNADVATRFNEMADLLEIEGANPSGCAPTAARR
jgi:hypothetical protein